MPSAFERVVRSVVRELDNTGQFTPVDSLGSSSSFRPYSLLHRKPSRSWFWKPRYTCVNMSIKDILEPEAPEPDLECVGPFLFCDATDGQLEGSVQLAGPGRGSIAAEAAVSKSHNTSMNVCRLLVDSKTLESLHRDRRLRRPEPKILQQLRQRGDNVFVVTEVLQTQQEVQVTQAGRLEGSGQLGVPGAMSFEGKGQGHLSRKRTVTIPEGSILAFRVAQLIIDSDWEKKQRTFQGPGRDDASSQSCVARCSLKHFEFEEDGSDKESGSTEDFRGLKAEVEDIGRQLLCMDATLSQKLLGGLAAALRDPAALGALEELLEQGLRGKQLQPLDGVTSAVLECLMLSSGELVEEIADPVLYLLGALTVLSGNQQELLAEVALDTEALACHLQLVHNLLEQSTPWQEPSIITLPTGLLERGWDENQPAWTLLEECGHELQAAAPHVHWEPQAQDRTCALYTCLAFLCGLSRQLR
ncbi:gasdermin-D isoform X2 [Ochotona princeps]|uniref:gasdermin-D isoform X2 n=1 Tax=Ochotona princeps TaxID=9978 RepID=UPI0027152ADB|nr:gasdermin-D isoform X2 [Ochotona princeps]